MCIVCLLSVGKLPNRAHRAQNKSTWELIRLSHHKERHVSEVLSPLVLFGLAVRLEELILVDGMVVEECFIDFAPLPS